MPVHRPIFRILQKSFKARHCQDDNGQGQMIWNSFDIESWIDRVAEALGSLARELPPYLEAYWQDYPREYIIENGRDETPFPLGDLRMVFAKVRHSRIHLREASFAPLRSALDPARHALLSHPMLERVAVSGRLIRENDFCRHVPGSDSTIWASDLIAGLMARAADMPRDGFRVAVRELGAFLTPVGDDEAARVLGNLDEGFDMLLFYGLTVRERIDVEDGMVILPFAEVRPYVDQKWVGNLAPVGAGAHGWRSVGAVVRPFRWRPEFRVRCSVNGPVGHSPALFFPEARSFLDLLAVSHGTPIPSLAAITDCIDSCAERLFGFEARGPGIYQKFSVDGFDGFTESPVVKQAEFRKVREAFANRESPRFQNMTPYIARLAEALGRNGRFAKHDRVMDVAIALEGMYALPRRGKLRKLEERVSGFLGTNPDNRKKIVESVRSFYDARSDIVHSGPGKPSPFRDDAAFLRGFDLARRSLFRFMKEGTPRNWSDVDFIDE